MAKFNVPVGISFLFSEGCYRSLITGTEKFVSGRNFVEGVTQSGLLLHSKVVMLVYVMENLLVRSRSPIRYNFV